MDVRESLRTLRQRTDVDPARVGIIGFCMGGFTALLAAAHTDIAVAVSYYGGGVVRPREGIGFTPFVDQLPRVTIPVLCFFGDQDAQIPLTDVEAIRQTLGASGAVHEIVIYPGAGHGFFCDVRAAYHPSSAADSWRRTLDWLQTTLK
jgi:carboxymethylenebutenolidase